MSQSAIFGGGCYWCIEAIFQRLKGISNVESGFANGKTQNPTYKQVCSGQTGFAEVVKFDFDPNIIQYEDLLRIFFFVHDPTTLNRQGGDQGTQYRSIIVYLNEQQKQSAQKIIKEFTDNKQYKDTIVTEVSPQQNYHKAEQDHQNYYNRIGGQNPYCSAVVDPKVKKFIRQFKDKLQYE